VFSIGELARHGRISVRMLRHYDALGLIRPAHVDPASGYRYYAAVQLSDLNRIVALADLGFTLKQIRGILCEHVSAAELRGMLRLCKADIESQIQAETARLARVEARLLSIEDASRVPVDGVVVKRLTALRDAELTGIAESYEPSEITAVIRPLYSDLWPRVCRAPLIVAGHGISYYEDSSERPGAVLVCRSQPIRAKSAGWVWWTCVK